MLPIPLLRLFHHWFGFSKISRIITILIAGILMGFYARMGALLAVKYLSDGYSVLSYWEGRHYLLIVSPIAGAISGIFLQSGIQLRTTINKLLFIFGLLVLLMLALFTGILIMTPD